MAPGADRSSVRYVSHRPDQMPLMLHIRDLAATRMRYGCFRMDILLAQGWLVNISVYRLYREDGLSLRLRRPRRNVGVATIDGAVPLCRKPDLNKRPVLGADSLPLGDGVRIEGREAKRSRR